MCICGRWSVGVAPPYWQSCADIKRSVCVISIIRLVLLTRINNNDNLTVRYVVPAIWTTLEVSLAIITASAPALKPFVARFFTTSRMTVSKPMTAAGVRDGRPTDDPDTGPRRDRLLSRGVARFASEDDEQFLVQLHDSSDHRDTKNKVLVSDLEQAHLPAVSRNASTDSKSGC